ncbi:hypothetical protein LCGC14_1499350 [marine sediment metagenome]|uniref:Uncharacterized protein n=1 Tax=marine sediment metagenome TaxID=412755 RepID=A0A0F9J4F9_9ZZZZ
MVIDTDILREKVRLYYANKADEVDNNSRLSDKAAINRLTKLETYEINSLVIINDIEHIQKTIT